MIECFETPFSQWHVITSYVIGFINVIVSNSILIYYIVYTTFILHNFGIYIYNNGYLQICKEDKRSRRESTFYNRELRRKNPRLDNADYSSEASGEVGLEPGTDVYFPKEQNMLCLPLVMPKSLSGHSIQKQRFAENAWL